MKTGILQANLEALRQCFPRLADRVAHGSACNRVIVSPTASGLPTLEVLSPSGERVLYHSRHDPRREALRWAGAPENRDPPRVVLFGLGLGYHALALLASSTREYLCIYEPRMDICRAALENVDLRPLLNNPNVQLVCGEPAESLYRTLFVRMGEFLSAGFDFLILPGAPRACPDEVKQTEKEIQRLAAAGHGMLRHMEATGYHTQRHLLRNIPAIYRALPPSAVKGLLVGRPALIVAAGPSLDKNLKLIPEAVGRAAIFATDTSLRLLQRCGVEPQFVLTKDPSELNERHFEGIDDLGRTVFVFDPQVSPRLVERFRGLSIFLPHRCHGLHDQLPGRHLAAEDILPFSQNVALAAFHLARLMGCNPIVFVGLDLAFPPDSGRSHAGGTALEADVSTTAEGQMVYRRPEGGEEFREQVETILVPAIDGSTVPTSPNFYEAIRYLEAILAESDVLCIDATEGGARIEGTQSLTFRETLDLHMTEVFNAWAHLEHLRQATTPSIPRRLFQDLAAVVTEAGEKAQRELSTVSAHIDPDSLSSLLQRFQAVRGELEGGFRLYWILELALERLFVTIRAPDYFALSDDPSSQRRSLERYIHYFTEIHRACTTIGPVFEELSGAYVE